MHQRHNDIMLGKIGIPNATLFHRREQHRGDGKELLAVPLDKAGCGSADTDDQVKRALGKEGAKVLGERKLRVFIAEAGRYKRKVDKVQRPWRLATEFVADRFGIFAPWPEFLAE